MPPTLGQLLKHAREARKLSIADINHSTRIPAQRIQDLEADRYTGSGSLTYAKSFLTTYSKFLDVDASSVLNQIQPPPLGGVRDYHYLVENLGHWVDDKSNSPPMEPPQTIVPAPRSIWIAAVIFTMVVLLSFTGWHLFAGARAGANSAVLKSTERPIPRAEVVVTPTEPVGAAVNTPAENEPVVRRAHAPDGTVLPPTLAVEDEEFTVLDVILTPAGNMVKVPTTLSTPVPRAVPVP